MTLVRRRAVVVALALGLAAGLAGCSSESVVPAPSSPVAYAAVGAGPATPGDTVAVVRTATGTKGTPVTVGTLPSGLALLPGDRELLVTVKAQNQLAEIDTSTGRVTGRVTVGLEPDAVAVTPDGRTALVANFGDDTVTVVRLPALTVGPTVKVGRQPVAVAVTPDGRRALVVDYGDGSLTPVSLPSLVAGPPVPVGAGPVAVFAASATEALVADFQTNSLTPVSLPSLTPQAAVPIGADPTGISGAPGSAVAWVSAGFGITPVSVTGGLVGKAVPVHVPAQCIAVTRTDHAWVCGGNGSLVEVDLSARKVVRTVGLDGIPAAVAVTDAAGT